MAVESTIEAADGWFCGESKVLAYALLDGDDATGWALAWTLSRRREGDAPVLTKTTSAGVVGLEGSVNVVVNAEDTIDLPDDDYHVELWRTDAGFEALLSYGVAVLRQAAEA